MIDLYRQKTICDIILNYAQAFAPNFAYETSLVLKNEDFLTYPASVDKHHCYEGGLLQHTYEVICLAMNLNTLKKDLNTEAIFLGALLHDIGKIEVYYKHIDKYYKKLEYSKTLHISESLRLYQEYFETSKPLLNNVIHIIKSHHGPIEHGSLEEPQTPEAWAVHLADMQSAFCLGGRK